MTERFGGELRAAKKSIEKPVNESARTPERAETWTPEQLEKRHRIATLAVQMEKAMRGTQEDRMRLEQTLEETPISEKLKRAFHNVAIGYMTMCANAKDAEARLRGHAENDEEFGVRLFQLRTLAAPKGTVAGERREGYFVITCNTYDDYAKFNAPNAPYEKESAGAYHHALTLDAGSGFPPIDIIVVNGTHDASEPLRTIDHERQHWINDKVLSAFGWSERGSKESDLATNPKDEVLAYLRDGSSGLSLQRALLESGFYGQLFQTDTQTRVEIVKKIGNIVGKEWDLFPPEARAVLVAQLYDVPFAEIPGACQAFARYYGERRETVLRSVGLSFEELKTMSHAARVVHARQLHELQQSFVSAYHDFEHGRGSAMRDVLGTHGKFIPHDQLANCGVPLQRSARQLRDAYAHFTQAIENQQPAPLPTVKIEWGLEDAHQRSALQLAQEMIDIACTIPQTDVDRACNEAAQHHVSHRMDTLGKRLAKMLTTHTGMSYPSIIVTDTSQDALELRITQEKTDRLPEISFYITLHASRSDTARAAA